MSTIVEVGVAVPAAGVCFYVALVILVSINLRRGDGLARIGGGVGLQRGVWLRG